MTPQTPPATAPERAHWIDLLVLVACVLLLSATWTARLGLYSDDWDYAARLRNAPQSLAGLCAATWDDVTRVRPLQVLTLALLHRVFGESWPGYHATAALVFAGAVLLLYALALEVLGSRALALALAAIYAHLPHFASARLWIAALQAPLALLFMLMALRLDIAQVAAPKRARRLLLTVASVGALVASLLSYEVFMPLFLLSPVLMAWHARLHGQERPWGLMFQVGLRNLIALGLLAWAKLAWTTRVKPFEPSEQLAWFAWLLRRAVRVTLFHEYGAGLGGALQRTRERGLPMSGWVVVVLGAVLTAAALTLAQHGPRPAFRVAWRRSSGLIVLGCGLFIAGYAVFLFTGNAFITATGLANRIAIAAALGLALVLTGLVGLARALAANGRIGAGLLTVGTSACVAIGSTLLQVQAGYWAEARRQQEQLTLRLLQRVPRLPSDVHLLIDGPCPYVGPAPVLEGALDASGLLRFLYRDATLVGDMVTPKLRLEDEGAVTHLYAQRLVHPYEHLYVFQVDSGRLHTLPTRAAAEAYFRDVNPARGAQCPPAGDGRGVAIFR